MIKRKILLTALCFVFMITYNSSKACTNLLVGKKASADGSTFITYAADSHSLYGELYFYPAAVYAPNTMLDVYDWDSGKYLGQIKQVEKTFQVVGNMNEHQLSIAETTYGGRKELKNKNGKLDYGSLIWITLQRAKTAKEAIRIMGELVAEYGYCSSGESFSIADPNEIWIMEMIGKGEGNKGAVWVARRIPDDCISAHANQARITTFPLKKPEECIYSKDVIDFAREKGYFTGKDKDFSFADAYAPLDFGALRFCEARVWSMFRRVNSDMEKYADYAMGTNPKNRMPLWVKPQKKVSLHDAMELMRDHYEGTPMDMTKDVGAGAYKCPYRWRGLTWEYENETYFNERAISTQQTAFSFVAQMRNWLPASIGGVLWFGVDDTYSTVYVPMYCSIREVPKPFRVGNGSFNEFTWKSAFWVFNFVTNYAYSRYSDMIIDIRKVQAELEGNFIARQSEVEKEAEKLYEKAPEKARKYLTDYSCEMSKKTLKRWKNLGEFLIFKYLDGNVKNEFNKPTHPGYSKKWRKEIVKETGDKFKMKEVK